MDQKSSWKFDLKVACKIHFAQKTEGSTCWPVWMCVTPLQNTNIHAICLLYCSCKDLSNSSKNLSITYQKGVTRTVLSSIGGMLNIVQLPRGKSDIAILSVDTKNSFGYRWMGQSFKMLKRFGFGEKNCMWVELFYKNPIAAGRISNTVSKSFNILRYRALLYSL